uniref:MENTAL domain-containing protein n=1 Tax=Maylandia zebra TaxID=106582 RepID=A0A3P9B5F3_9CICH
MLHLTSATKITVHERRTCSLLCNWKNTLQMHCKPAHFQNGERFIIHDFNPEQFLLNSLMTFLFFVKKFPSFLSAVALNTLLSVCVCQVNGGIQNRLEQEVLHYDYHLLAVFRFAVLILAYAVCKLRHWWAIAVGFKAVCHNSLLSLGAFGYLLPIISFVLAWIETWLLDFKVLPQEIEDENRHQSIIDTSRAPLLGPGPLSDGQFYSPPESLADSDEELDDKHEPEKGLITQMT